jgi:hypothetical protein
MRTARISALGRKRLTGVPLRGDVGRNESFLNPVWANCIIATISSPLKSFLPEAATESPGFSV